MLTISGIYDPSITFGFLKHPSTTFVQAFFSLKFERWGFSKICFFFVFLAFIDSFPTVIWLCFYFKFFLLNCRALAIFARVCQVWLKIGRNKNSLSMNFLARYFSEITRDPKIEVSIQISGHENRIAISFFFMLFRVSFKVCFWSEVLLKWGVPLNAKIFVKYTLITIRGLKDRTAKFYLVTKKLIAHFSVLIPSNLLILQ